MRITSKHRTIIIVIIAVIITMFMVIYQNPGWFISRDQNDLLSYGRLYIGNQQPGNQLVVTSAVVPYPGFIVVRNDLGQGHFGSIIAVSGYLDAGRYKNISLSVEDQLHDGQSVVSAIVVDNGNNHLDDQDQLLTNSRGQVVFDTAIVGAHLP